MIARVDKAFALLEPYLRDDGQPCLLVADENLGAAPFSAVDAAVEIISNRFDIARAAQAVGLRARFSDFDFSDYPAHHFVRVCYRLSKEKAVVEHVIRQAGRILRVDGELLLCGAKNEGLKRFGKYAADLLRGTVDSRKIGSLYLARISNRGNATGIQPPADDYGRILPVEVDLEALGLPPVQGRTRITLSTKAGMFGAGRIDAGSTLLARALPEFFEGFIRPPRSVLDLGCGCGYLGICASGFAIDRIVATDNCAAAIETCKMNAANLCLPMEVIADDCARSISERFDALLCNPPFHQGFKVNSDLGVRFLRAAGRCLKPEGRALFVVNQFIALEKLASPYFAKIDVVAPTPSFKLVALSTPRPE